MADGMIINKASCIVCNERVTYRSITGVADYVQGYCPKCGVHIVITWDDTNKLLKDKCEGIAVGGK